MKRSILYLAIMACATHVFSQNSSSLDSTIKNIDSNVSALKDELVKEETPPFTGQSIFEDRKGSSAIFLPQGGTFKINTNDASLTFSFTNYQVPQPDSATGRPVLKPYYGFEISGKTNDGILPLISGGNVTPGTKLNGILGKPIFDIKPDQKGQILGTLTLRAGYEGSTFKLYNPDTIFSKQIEKISFNSFSTSLAFNVKFGGNKILAISSGFKKSNNYDELDEISLTDKSSISDTATNTTRSFESVRKVRTGDYKTFDQIPINVDFLWIPKGISRVGLYHFWRTQISSGKVTNGLGSGLYLLKKNNPFASIAGIVIEVSDLAKMKEGFGENISVNLVVGYNFGFKKNN